MAIRQTGPFGVGQAAPGAGMLVDTLLSILRRIGATRSPFWPQSPLGAPAGAASASAEPPAGRPMSEPSRTAVGSSAPGARSRVVASAMRRPRPTSASVTRKTDAVPLAASEGTRAAIEAAAAPRVTPASGEMLPDGLPRAQDTQEVPEEGVGADVGSEEVWRDATLNNPDLINRMASGEIDIMELLRLILERRAARQTVGPDEVGLR